MGKINYTRGTSYYLTVVYTAGPAAPVSAKFTAKTEPNDSDSTDTTNAIFAPKSGEFTGSTFPYTLVMKISPGDVAVSVPPANNYSYSVKVTDTNGDEWPVDSGTFNLIAITTNEV